MGSVPPIAVVVYLIWDAICGMVIGALSGWIASLVTKGGSRGIWKDALFGSFGFLAGYIGAVFMPWHENTITYQLSGGTTVTSTMNSYQHPERVAVAVAVVLPILYEIYRFSRMRRNQARCQPTSETNTSNGQD